MQSSRNLWLRLHRWIALSVGWILAAVALCGAVLVVAQPVDRWAHPEFFVARNPSAPGLAKTVPLEPVRQRLVAEFGAKSNFTIRPPHDAVETLWVMVRGDWRGTVYLDPSTGQEQGRREEDEGFVNTLFKLHSSLALQDTGKAILACIALSYLFLLTTGIVLWWPRRWPPSWRIEWHRGTPRALFDLHRVAGAVMGLFIAVSVASGAYMAWRPLGDFISAVAGSKPLKAPALPKLAGPPPPALALDVLVARAQAQFPGEPIGYVQVPGRADRPMRIRMRLSDDPHPNGVSSVYLDPRTGDVLAVHRWSDLDVGTGMVAYVYPLHTGELGGPLLEALVFANGIVLGGLGITGVWLWWKRRAVKKPRAALQAKA